MVRGTAARASGNCVNSSVVQRTLYLMGEERDPIERYQELYGFDEVNARGRPCQTLPRFGNIPADIKVSQSFEALKTSWNETHDALELLLRQSELLEDELPVAEEMKRQLCELSKNRPRDGAAMNEIEGEVMREMHVARTHVDSLLERRKEINVEINALKMKIQEMGRIKPEVAYLQACSEFYLLRQQEEVEAQISLEQARAFRRQMGPTVNEVELEREHRTLQDWRADAVRIFGLTWSKKRGGSDNTESSAAATLNAA